MFLWSQIDISTISFFIASVCSYILFFNINLSAHNDLLSFFWDKYIFPYPPAPIYLMMS